MVPVKGFDVVIRCRVLLDHLLQQTCEKIANCLFGPLFIVTVDAHCRNVVVLEECLEMVYDDRTSVNV